MPALNTPIGAEAILRILELNDVEIHDHFFKEGQLIYTAQSLNWDKSFEGVLTFCEGRDFSHVDGGLMLTEGTPVNPLMSYITVSFPRVAMALVLNDLFPGWEEDTKRIAKGWNVKIGENSSIGNVGFGWIKHHDRWLRFPHVGGLIVHSGVTIGSNVTVCRGVLSDTIIGPDSHIDDHVHIAHGVQIGRGVIIVANAMIAGSVVIEDDAWIGPSASIMQGVRIGAGATIGMGAVVLRDVAPGETVVGHHRVIDTKEKQLGVTR